MPLRFSAYAGLTAQPRVAPSCLGVMTEAAAEAFLKRDRKAMHLCTDRYLSVYCVLTASQQSPSSHPIVDFLAGNGSSPTPLQEG